MAASPLSLKRIMPVYADADTGIVKIRLATHFVERDRYSQRFFSYPKSKPLERLQRITWVDGRLEFRPCQKPRLKLGKPVVVGKTECGFSRGLDTRQIARPTRSNRIHSTSSCSAALIQIFAFPLYISIRPVILTCFSSMPESTSDLSPVMRAGSSR